MKFKLIAKYILARALMVYRLLGGDRMTINRYFSNTPEAKLHISSGTNILGGWLNTDYFPLNPKTIHLDATKHFPFENETFDFVFSEHMIEHLPYPDGMSMLSEINRTLKKNGVLRIATPDLQFLIDLTAKNRSEVQDNYIRWTAAKNTPYANHDHEEVFVVNNFFYNYGHRFIYTKELLKDMLIEAGFKVVSEQKIMISSTSNLHGLENTKKLPPGFLELESVILEATN